MKVRINQIYTHKKHNHIKLVIINIDNRVGIEYRYLTDDGWLFTDQRETKVWSQGGKRLKYKETLFRDFDKTGTLKKEVKEVLPSNDVDIENENETFLKRLVYKQKNQIAELKGMYKTLEKKYNKEAVDFKNSKKTDVIKDKKTNVYVMVDHNTGFYKIGRSVKPKVREKTLQSEKPTIDMLFNYPSTNKEEVQLHEMFKDKRVRGEWFDLTYKDLDYIKEKLKN